MADGVQGESERRDHQAVAHISHRYRAILKRYFSRRRFSPEEAEDATQDVLVRLARKSGLADVDNLEGYVFGTAASVATDMHRRRQTRRAEQHMPYEEDLHARRDHSPEDIHLGRAQIGILIGALQELPDRMRHAFVLARMEGLTHSEIGRRLGISVSAVEKHIIKAAAHLAIRMGRT